MYNLDMPSHYIHYTSCDSLFGILNSCQLRLHNLFNLNDSSELKFALSDFDFNLLGDVYKEQKQYMFVNSFCGYNMNLQDEDYNLWRLYGKEGFGAALVFEIENYESEWNHFTFGKVQYGKNNKLFDNLKKITDYYSNRTKNVGISLPAIIPMMCMLYKNEVWKIESEYRLFASLWYNDRTFIENIPLENYFLWTTLNHYITDRGDKGAFTCIPFNLSTIKEEMRLRSRGHDIEQYFDHFPHLKLKRVILGYNVNETKSKKIIEYSSQLTRVKLNYSVEFIESKFRKEFK